MRRRGLWIVIVALIVAGLLVTGCERIMGGGEEFVFGVILVGPNDHGSSEAHYEAGKYVEESVRNTKMVYRDKLNPSDREGTTLEQVVDDMVSQGAELIFATSDDFAAATDEVAAKYPNIKFVHISGDHVKTGKAPRSVRNFMGKMYYMKAVAGCAAALKTETDAVGYLGPLINDETRRLAAAAYLGCRDCYERYRGGDPDDLRFTVNWIGYWFNIPDVTLDPTKVSSDMINSGADVLISGIDTTEAIVVAGERYERGEEVWAVPYDHIGACEVKPEVCLGVPYFNWGPAYVRYVQDARNDEWEHDWQWGEPYWPDINDRDKTTVGYKFGPALAEEDQARLEEYISDLGSGDVKLFEGPLYLQDGTQYLEPGEEATEEEIWYLPQLLRGMEGASS